MLSTKTKCLCPMCSNTHYRVIWWTGNGTPRKYCEKCLRMFIMRESYAQRSAEKYTKEKHETKANTM